METCHPSPRSLARRSRVLLVAAVASVLVVMTPGCASGCSEGPGADNILAYVERWVRIRSLRSADEISEGSIELEFEGMPVHGGGVEGRSRLERIEIHDSFLPGIVDAVHDGDHVFLGLVSEGLQREGASFVLVRDPAGDHHFLGGCMQEGERFLRDRLGSDYDATIEQLIGSTDPEQTLELLGVT